MRETLCDSENNLIEVLLSVAKSSWCIKVSLEVADESGV